MRAKGAEMTDGSKDMDALFSAAARQRMAPSDALMARVLADGLAEQPRAPQVQSLRPPVVRPVARPMARPGLWAGFWAGLTEVFGGGGALAGIGTAAVAGVVIGFAQPAGLGPLTEAVFGTPLETVELIPSVETLFAEN